MISYIDMHCDTLAEAVELGRDSIISFDERAIDVARLEKGNCKAQFFAAYLDQDKSVDPYKDYTAMRQVLLNTVSRSDKLVFTGNSSELNRNFDEGKISAFLTIENGCLVEGKMERLKELKEQGVSLITLTWNQANCFGFPHSSESSLMAKGLTDFGKEAIEEMNNLGIIVDVSHLSDGGFYDVAAISKKPFVASHSNCRSIAPHTRNLTDEMIRIVAEKGGVIGLNFAADFLNPDLSHENSTVDMLFLHAKHIIEVGGVESIGIGTDFDGITCKLEIPSCDKMPLLFEAFEKRGMNHTSLEYLAYKNVERVIKDCL